MKILGVVGSPRKKGNTDILVQEILKGAQEAGAETETVHLDGLTILPCNGCHSCWKNDDCVKNDDMGHLYDLIGSADVIVFGTPVYWFGPSATMKGFLDRFVYFNCPQHQSLIRGKKAILAIPFEDEDLDTAKPLVDMFRKSFDYLGMDLSHVLLVPGVTRLGEVTSKGEVMRSALDIGKKAVR